MVEPKMWTDYYVLILFITTLQLLRVTTCVKQIAVITTNNNGTRFLKTRHNAIALYY